MLGNNTKTRIPETLWSNDRIWVKQNEDETYNSFILIISFYNDFLLYIILMQINELTTLATLINHTL